MTNEVSEEAESLLVFGLLLFHADTTLSLMNNVFELLLHHLCKHVTVAFEVIEFFLFFFSDNFVYSFSINLVVRVKHNDVCLHLVFLRLRHRNFAVLLSCLDELNDFLRVEILLVADVLHARFLLHEPFIVLHHLLVLFAFVIADVQEILFTFQDLLLLDELVSEFTDVTSSLLNIMQSNGKPDDLQLLLLNAGFVEQALLSEGV